MQFKPDKNKSSAKDNKAKELKEPDKVKPTLKEVEERLSQLAFEVENEGQNKALSVPAPGQIAGAELSGKSLQPTTKEGQVAAVKNTHINLYLFWGMVIFSILFANAPYVGWLLMPVNQFVVTVHEMSHAVVTWLTGGAVLGMTTVPDGAGHGGLTHSLGGIALFVNQAGYLGTTFFGCLLIYLSQFPRLSRHLLTFMGGAMILGALFFTLPGLINPGWFVQSVMSLVIEVLMGVAFIFAGRKLKPALANLMILFLAVQTALNSLELIWILVPHALGLSGSGFTDATSLAQVTMIPAIFWSLSWMFTSIVCLCLTLRFTYGAFLFKGVSKITTAYVKPKKN